MDPNRERDSDEDTWYYESFGRYDKLQMFEMNEAVKQLELMNEATVCMVLSDDTSIKSEISTHKFAESLFNGKKNPAEKMPSLKFSSGFFTSSPVVQIKTIFNTSKLIVSEENDDVYILRTDSPETDIMSKIASVEGGIKKARLAADRSMAIISGNSKKLLLDYETLKLIRELENNAQDKYPLYVDSNTICLGDVNTSEVTFYDLRDPSYKESLKPSDVNSSWAFASQYESLKTIGEEKEASVLYMLSREGNIFSYDYRSRSKPLYNHKSGLQCGTTFGLKVHPHNSERVLVYGVDYNVVVYDINENKNVFIHDGHAHLSETRDLGTRSTYALWLPYITSNTVVSGALNSTLHCWQFGAG